MFDVTYLSLLLYNFSLFMLPYSISLLQDVICLNFVPQAIIIKILEYNKLRVSYASGATPDFI